MSFRGRGLWPAYQKTTRPERPLLWAGDSTRGQLEGATIHELAGVFRVTDRGAPPINTNSIRAPPNVSRLAQITRCEAKDLLLALSAAPLAPRSRVFI